MVIRKLENDILKILQVYIKPEHLVFAGKWVNSVHLWERINYENSALWIERLINELSSENPQLDRCFVLLSGFFIDLEPNLNNKLTAINKFQVKKEKDLGKKIEILMEKNEPVKDYLLTVLSAREIARNIIQVLSVDEKAAITFLRNKYSHPVLNSYRVKIKKPEESEMFEFDLQKYIASGKYLTINEVELFDETKAKLVPKLNELNNLKDLLWDLRRMAC